MRELMFRGQTRRYGEKIKNFAGEKMESAWAYGPGVCKGNGDFSIIYGSEQMQEAEAIFFDKHSVYTDTLGQYTGVKDRRGRMIFEGDIIEGGDYNAEDGYGEIVWDESTARFAIIGRSGNDLQSDFDNYYGRELEVIGNVFDNPELVEEAKA